MKILAVKIKHTPSHRDCQRKTMSMSLSRQMYSKHCTTAKRRAHLLIVSLVELLFFSPSPSLSFSLSQLVYRYVHIGTYTCYTDITISRRGRGLYAVVPKVHWPSSAQCHSMRTNILLRRRISVYKASAEVHSQQHPRNADVDEIKRQYNV